MTFLRLEQQCTNNRIKIIEIKNVRATTANEVHFPKNAIEEITEVLGYRAAKADKLHKEVV